LTDLLLSGWRESDPRPPSRTTLPERLRTRGRRG